MHSSKNTYPVAIVGGGPVGLFLGICLHQMNIPCVILEKRKHIREGSRSLGIHPVSLDLFDALGIAKPFLDRGIKIRKGHAFGNREKIGTLSFEACPPPHDYILALPQSETEAILEKELAKLNPDILKRGAAVHTISQDDGKVSLATAKKSSPKTIEADYLVGCDGKNSFVRQAADITVTKNTYPDTYIMGDFSDNTNLGTDAAIFLCDRGLIESFPLPKTRRRWVVKTKNRMSNISRDNIQHRVNQRIGIDLENCKNYMLSGFGVQKITADSMINERIILAGDAAHVVSPIGGQGMNLGWLGAWDLAHSLKTAFENPEDRNLIFSNFEKRRLRAGKNAIRRAEMNMRLGRATNYPEIRNKLVSLMVTKPISYLTSRLFTMRGIEKWIF